MKGAHTKWRGMSLGAPFAKPQVRLSPLASRSTAGELKQMALSFAQTNNNYFFINRFTIHIKILLFSTYLHNFAENPSRFVTILFKFVAILFRF